MNQCLKLTKEVKLEIVERYLQGESSNCLSKIYGFHHGSLWEWVKKYQKNGIDGLGRVKKQYYSSEFKQQVVEECVKKQYYSSEFKQQVVEEYLSGSESSIDLALKYGITATRAVSRWAKQYNSHEDILKSSPGGRVRMTKGRQTTFAERIEIVEYCINNDSNYAQTAEQFQVSYGQVYTWVKKYNGAGISALKDNRGKGKPLEDMNEMERLQAENKLLEAKNRQLQMENDVLKKLEEIERGRSSVFNHRRRNI